MAPRQDIAAASAATSSPIRERGRSQAVDDYVKAIWLLLESGNQPTGQAIAARLSVSQASVTSMLRKLDDIGLVTWQRYRVVELTDSGRSLALEIVRHHRLIECLLAEVLGMPWDEVHDEAEVLEHHISERLEDLISARLGHPQFDPHGHPIPARDGSMPDQRVRPLSALHRCDRASISQVRDDRPEVLRYLADIGLVIGAEFEVHACEPLAGTITLALSPSTTRTIGSELAARIDVA
ncbi:MAG: metal-dependent transcriptional regulator [Thermoleophilia bacterium]|nr:metal-dependent transcriptional regulator [Thermoleophilia bacterium]